MKADETQFDNERESDTISVTRCKVQSMATSELKSRKHPTVILFAQAQVESPKLVVASASTMRQPRPSRTVDDTNIDYVSLMGREEAKKRFSEDVVDTELRESIRLQKMFRQIQREVRGMQDHKVEQKTMNLIF